MRIASVIQDLTNKKFYLLINVPNIDVLIEIPEHQFNIFKNYFPYSKEVKDFTLNRIVYYY